MVSKRSVKHPKRGRASKVNEHALNDNLFSLALDYI